MFKKSKTKLSVLIIAIVVFGIIFSTLAATLLFGLFYEKSMSESAMVSSKQSVSQANETVSNYVSSIKNKLDNLCAEADNCADTDSLQNAISTAARLEDDIYCVMIYDTQGNLLLNGNGATGSVKNGTTNLSFDKSVYSNLKDGYAITQPHVNTLYENQYPCLVFL